MISFERFDFYRGLSANYPIETPSIHKTRKNRRPRDVALENHLAADDWFDQKFGVRYRSQSLFLTSSRQVASAYAASPNHIARVIPLGEYRYCWSPIAQDLMEIFINRDRSGCLIAELESLRYKEEDLEQAHHLEHELMLYCESYICIPINLQLRDHN